MVIRILMVFLLAAAAGAAELVAIPGTDVSLPLPDGFAVAPDFPGIGLDADLTSVLVTELPVPFAIAKQHFDASALARGGVVLHRSDAIEVAGRPGLLLHATQRAAGLEFRKWLLVFGDDTESILLAATTPLDQESRHQAVLIETLRGVQWSPAEGRGAPESLPFRIEPVPPFEVVTSAANAVVLADPGFQHGTEVAPHVTVGVSLATVQIGDLAAFARERLKETPSISEIEIISESDASLDGMEARRVEATAHDLEQERPVRVLQLLATDGEHYYLIRGIADLVREGFETHFDAIAARFARTPADAADAASNANGQSPSDE